MKKLQRQEKAAHKFSKQRFMKLSQENDGQKTEVVDPVKNSQQLLVKKHLKADMMQILQKLVFIFLYVGSGFRKC
jgi:hypothetical protein